MAETFPCIEKKLEFCYKMMRLFLSPTSMYYLRISSMEMSNNLSFQGQLDHRAYINQTNVQHVCKFSPG
jgi:hypothetical protein